MHVVLVQSVDHGFWIWIILVEDWLAHRIPPKQILDDVVERYAQVAIFLRDIEQRLLRIVAILALPIAVRPLSEKRRGASQFTIRGDDFVEFRTVQKVVVDSVGNFRGQIERVHEAVVHAAARTVIPKNAISVAREEHRYRDICIVLRKLDVLAAIIPHASLVLPKS